jgi:5-methylcytosine-specific restriction endonuclease McrA
MNEYDTREQRKKFYKTADWRRVRRYVLRRDNYECQWCKEDGRVTTTNLEVDHIEELEKRPDLRLEPDNLRTLCIDCHNKRHKRFGENSKPKHKFMTPERW